MDKGARTIAVKSEPPDRSLFEAALSAISPRVRDGLAEAFTSGSSSIDLTEVAIDLTADPFSESGKDRLVLDHRQALTLVACLWADGFSAGAKRYGAGGGE